METAVEVFTKFQDDLNNLFKENKDFWKSSRIAAGNLQDSYSDDELYKIADEIKVLPKDKYPNAEMAASLIQAEISMKHITYTDAKTGKSVPLPYERVYK